MFEVWLIVAGSLAHALYPASGSHLLVGLVAPINESVWEHFKLAYLAMLSWHVLPSRHRWPMASRRALPTIAGVIIINIVVIGVFLFVRPMVHDPSARLGVDIGSYVVGCLLAGQFIRRWPWSWEDPRTFGIWLWMLVGLIFAYHSVWPPHEPLFIPGGMGR